MKRGIISALLIASIAASVSLTGCGEDENTKQSKSSKEVEAAADELAQDMSTSGWQWLYRPFTVTAQGIADAWRRDYTKSSVNPADGMRGGPTYETLPCVAMYLVPTTGDVNNGTATMLVTNTNQKKIECIQVKYTMHSPASNPNEKCTIRVTGGTNERGVDLTGRYFRGFMVENPLDSKQAEWYTNQLRSKYNITVEKAAAPSTTDQKKNG